jgi:hypothetical protein
MAAVRRLRSEGSHESDGGGNAKGGKKEMAGVERKVGVHAAVSPGAVGFELKEAAEARRPTHGAVHRSAGEPVLRRRDLTVAL